MVTADCIQIDPLAMCLAAEKQLRAENAVLWAFVDAFKRWGREEGSEAAVYEALADLIPYEGGRE